MHPLAFAQVMSRLNLAPSSTFYVPSAAAEDVDVEPLLGLRPRGVLRQESFKIGGGSGGMKARPSPLHHATPLCTT